MNLPQNVGQQATLLILAAQFDLTTSDLITGDFRRAHEKAHSRKPVEGGQTFDSLFPRMGS